ncbi:MAG: metallophosphoesterase [Verrucomicrobiota bacterium]
MSRLAPLICWGGWVILVCVWLLKNVAWFDDLMTFDLRAIKDTYAWNFQTIPRWFLGAAFFSGILGGIFRTENTKYWIITLVSIFGFVGLKGAQWYISVYEHGRLEERKVVIESPKIRDPISILHISDLEAPSIGKHERRALKRVADFGVDMVIFTGDLIELQRGDKYRDLWQQILPLLKAIDPPLGFYGVYGDGDSKLYSISVSRDSPLTMLGIAPKFVRKGETLLCLKGLSLYQSRTPDIAEHHIEGWLSALSKDTFSIVIGHGPDFIPAISDNFIDLCLAGHTHGGQVHLPFLGPLTVNSEFPKEYAKGYHEIGNIRLNISAGLGSDRHRGMPIIRLGCPTEMTLIELRPET